MSLIKYIFAFIFYASALFAGNSDFIRNDKCVKCHLLNENTGKGNSVIEWKKSIHFRRESDCAACHGSDKTVDIDFKRGHIGIPGSEASIDICGKCHKKEKSDFLSRRSNNNTLLKCKTTCVNCHSYHRVEKAHGNLINKSTCSKCHSPKRAEKIITSIKRFQKSIEMIEKTIAFYEKSGVPVSISRLEIKDIKKEFSHSIHSIPAGILEEEIIDKSINSLNKLKVRMKESSPDKWNFEGIIIVSFLIIVLILIVRYQKIINFQKN